MCKCDPSCRTPFCGLGNCKFPASDIESVILQDVEVQENGIIRNCKGRLIGHLIEEIDYKGEHITALSNASREVVICSAVVADDGMVYRGHRHNNCINLIREVKKIPKEQGFITSKNRFVGRKEAYKIQIEAGIESRDGYHHILGELFSEDLY